MVIIVGFHVLMELTKMDIFAVLAIMVAQLVLVIGMVIVPVAQVDIIFNQVQPTVIKAVQVRHHIGIK